MLEMEKAAVLLKLLGDKTRLSMLKLIEHSECCVCEFVEIFQMSQPAVSQHLRKLKDAGLIKENRKRNWVFYSLNEEYEYYSFIQTILQQLPDQREHIIRLEEQGMRIICD
ncbi:ArsR/SmtB family transcription factor [Bacillus kexueae]|uniref:ArsR/SmtB family transcription factor n=1 Tax=Aeribacillus kexueae TaxID=2078952 RepID=UPI001FAF7A2B|nr:metalloregulator ArsR/SmtB family transcription factor [Bacillus kexueae]